MYQLRAVHVAVIMLGAYRPLAKSWMNTSSSPLLSSWETGAKCTEMNPTQIGIN